MGRLRVAVLLALPLVALPVLMARVADEQATRIAAGLARASSALGSTRASEEQRDREVVADWRAELADLWDELGAAPAPAGDAESSPARRRVGAASPRGLRVRANTVLALANQGARPSGIYVAAEGTRPAGLMLLGVSGLGVGLRDGDILTHAAGQKATSEGQVVSLVLSARGARQAQIAGRVWRQGVSFPLLVDQPYLSSQAEPRPAKERAKREPIARRDDTG